MVAEPGSGSNRPGKDATEGKHKLWSDMESGSEGGKDKGREDTQESGAGDPLSTNTSNGEGHESGDQVHANMHGETVHNNKENHAPGLGKWHKSRRDWRKGRDWWKDGDTRVGERECNISHLENKVNMLTDVVQQLSERLGMCRVRGCGCAMHTIKWQRGGS
jgi:hypothetical protein